ncbi:hypothetical protein EON63_20950 [archaeon]|nr:MAG: hypothetical protein EON63_20950 [archaeon]
MSLGIYIKSNPGTNGTGIIEHIIYRNIYMDTPLWWPIWIGPQQQNQPGRLPSCLALYYCQPHLPPCAVHHRSYTIQHTSFLSQRSSLISRFGSRHGVQFFIPLHPHLPHQSPRHNTRYSAS